MLGICVREAFPSDDSDLESDDISMCPQESRTSSFDLPRAQGDYALGEERDCEGKGPINPYLSPTLPLGLVSLP